MEEIKVMLSFLGLFYDTVDFEQCCISSLKGKNGFGCNFLIIIFLSAVVFIIERAVVSL